MERVTVVRRYLVALLLAAPMVALALPSAEAQATPDVRRSGACMELDPNNLDADLLRGYADDADDVFVGDVSAVSTMTGGGHKPRSYTHVVRVDKVFAGDLESGDTVDLMTTPKRAADGLGRLHRQGTYLFFTTDVELSRRDHLLAPSAKTRHGARNRPTVAAVDCAGTTELPNGLSANLRDQIDQILTAGSTPTTAPVLSDPAGGASEPPALGRTIAPGIALALLGVLGLVFFSWLGRRRA